MLKYFILFLLLPTIALADTPALRIDSCLKSSECDRKNKNPKDWHTDIIPVPEGEVCSPMSAIDEAIKWLEKNRPDSHWAGSACIIIKGQET